jgi:hypothetical protein
MFDMDSTFNITLGEHTGKLIVRTPWFLRTKVYLEVDGEELLVA